MATDQPPQKSWLRRNWIWVFAAGCLTPIIACGVGITLIFALVFGALRSSEVYADAVRQARASPEVQARLGSPIKVGLWVSGSINLKTENGTETGDADLTVPLSGPKGTGTGHAVAHKAGGKWTYSTLEVVIPGNPAERIDLRAAAAH
jgi:hypothetical protein